MKNIAAIPQALLVRISAPINHTAVLVVQWGIVLRSPHCTLHACLSEESLTSASFAIIVTFTATDTCLLHRPKKVLVLTLKERCSTPAMSLDSQFTYNTIVMQCKWEYPDTVNMCLFHQEVTYIRRPEVKSPTSRKHACQLARLVLSCKISSSFFLISIFSLYQPWSTDNSTCEGLQRTTHYSHVEI